jgi:hypothetical protein
MNYSKIPFSSWRTWLLGGFYRCSVNQDVAEEFACLTMPEVA